MNRQGKLLEVLGVVHIAAAITLLLAPGALAENIDPDGDGSQYAWGENIGWVSAEQDVDGDGNPDQGVNVEDYWVTGWMWGENVGWISLHCLNTKNCGQVIHVVRNDGDGGLTGWAWGENIGWISFSCENTESCGHVDYGVTVDVQTGEFGGNAWAENVGWIRFDWENEAVRPYRIKSDWSCAPPPSPPEGPSELMLAKANESVKLTWTTPPGATGFDVVLGDLDPIRATGDYAAATRECIANHHPVTVLLDETELGSGEGVWFLVRAINCGNDASYDSGNASQSGMRDGEIAASGNDCG